MTTHLPSDGHGESTERVVATDPDSAAASSAAPDASFVLPPDVMMVPVAELAPKLREQFAHADGDVAIMRPRLRRPSRLVSADMALLLSAFRTPTRIADAVVGFSRSQRRDPAQVLDSAFEALQSLVNSKVLAVAGSTDDARIEPCYAAGQWVARHEILRPVQVLDDSELYHARDGSGGEVALKVLRPGWSAGQADAIDREAAILQQLGGCCSPRLIASGGIDGRPFLVTSWCAGDKLSTRAEALRGRAGSRAALHRLGLDVVRAYALLHAAGVVHADVHAGNILVDRQGVVTLVDFGLSRQLDPTSPHHQPPRSSVAWFYEPEAAAALLADGAPCPASLAGEQYALATLLYHLHTGAYPVQAQADLGAVLAQISQARLLPFAARGAVPWPALEAVLSTAMQRDPAQRFASTAAFCAALAALRPPRGTPTAATRSRQRATAAPHAPLPLVEQMIERIDIDGPLFASGLPQPPTASLNHGAAGIGWFCYRVAQLRAKPALLAVGEAWLARASALDEPMLSTPGADPRWFAPELGLTAARLGTASTAFGAGGVFVLRALLGHAASDLATQVVGIDEFLRTASPTSRPLDLTLGLAGQLIGASLLLDTTERPPLAPPPPLAASRQRLVAFVGEALRSIDRFIGSRRQLLEVPELAQSGIAHGWAGLLYAVLRASRAASLEVPHWAAAFLHELARQARRQGRGLAWPAAFDAPTAGDAPAAAPGDMAPGWCHGSAGQVHLWTLAHDVIGEPRYLDLAVRAGWHAVDHPGRGADLCCGLAGRAFALLALYRHCGEDAWLRCAKALARRAEQVPESAFTRPMSLYRGRLGVATLMAELERPEWAVMPFFAAEGWPRQSLSGLPHHAVICARTPA